MSEEVASGIVSGFPVAGAVGFVESAVVVFAVLVVPDEAPVDLKFLK